MLAMIRTAPPKYSQVPGAYLALESRLAWVDDAHGAQHAVGFEALGGERGEAVHVAGETPYSNRARSSRCRPKRIHFSTSTATNEKRATPRMRIHASASSGVVWKSRFITGV